MKNKSIRIALCNVLAVILFLFSVTPAFAEVEHSYSIDELKVSVTLPTYMDVITRNLSTNDEVYKRHSKSVANFQEYGIYLQGFSQDGKQVFTVSMDKDENSQKVDNYNTLDENQLNQIKEKFTEDEYCQSCSMDTYNGVIFFDSIINTPKDDKTLYVTKADTLVNGMYIHFTLQSNDGEIDEDDKEFMTTVLQKLRFEEKEKSFFDSTIVTFIIVIGTVLAVIIIAIIIYNTIRKKKRQNRLKKYDDELYRSDRKARREAEISRKNRNTATGAERPDAFFDGVDGMESSINIDEIERTLIKEAHSQEEKYTTEDAYSETEEFGKEKLNHEKFLDDKNRNRKDRNKDRNKGRKF